MSDAAGRRIVVRRPPLGKLLASAHDVAREHRLMTALAPTGVHVPEPLALCEDLDVIGAPFTVVEHVEGIVLSRPADALTLDPDIRYRVGQSLVDELAALHAVDIDEAGLGGAARRGGYAERQLRRWSQQWEATKGDSPAPAAQIAERLLAIVPQGTDTTIVHGDYRLDNVIFDPAGELQAVLDWELWTLGDPLADLGLMLVYWVEPGDASQPLGVAATTAPGFPSRDELAARYAQVSGRDIGDLDFYVALGAWKLAIILQGVFSRASAGAYGENGVQVENLPASIDALFEKAESLLDSSERETPVSSYDRKEQPK